MSTEAQVTANQANAQFSTGPKSDAGKAASSRNNLRHGLTGKFQFFGPEESSQFDRFLAELLDEHQPATPTERLLVEKMAEHAWLGKRALVLQESVLISSQPLSERKSELALFLRYQTTHDRAFQNSLNQLLKLKAEKRKAEIGFETQKLKQAEEVRKQTNENRKQELHTWKVLMAEAEVDHRILLNRNLEVSQNRLHAAQKAA